MSQLPARVRAAIRARHFSVRTAEAYIHRVRQYILFSEKRQPAAPGPPEIRAFVSHLATARDVAASPQNLLMASLLSGSGRRLNAGSPPIP